MGIGDHHPVVCILVLQEGYDRDVVLGHDAVEDVLCLPEVGSLKSDMVELHQMLINQGEPTNVEKRELLELGYNDTLSLRPRFGMVLQTYLEALKKVAQPSTFLRSFSGMVLARDLGQKTLS